MLASMASPPDERGSWNLDLVIERLMALERRIGELERALRESTARESTPAPQGSDPSPSASQRSAPVVSADRPKPFDEISTSHGLDLETLIAGRWLNRIGIVALLLATAFFL